jgi:hypothetical protein
MEPQSILDPSLLSPTADGDLSGSVAPRSAPPSVSAGIAAASAQAKSAEATQLFPNEDGGRSLAAMACRDLDAALQLLAERAQYITGASGAMIALRRGEHNDMLCRASAGSNAPALGALFSLEYGFSGESVRTRKLLRCDDAERDPRVNRAGCRQLGIASVVVTPVLSGEQVLGVFELFSGKPHAFDERALSALRRLSEMVETAVKYAVAAQTVSAMQDQSAVEEFHPPMDEIKLEVETDDNILATDDVLATDDILATEDLLSAPNAMGLVPSESETTKLEKTELSTTEVPKEVPKEELKTEPEKAELKNEPDPPPRKQLFWSAAMQNTASAAPIAESAASTPVPSVLRNLQKCQACGFPVSQGRAFCVECEERQWRGQRLSQTSARGAQQLNPEPIRAHSPGIPVSKDSSSSPIPAPQTSAQSKDSIGDPQPSKLPSVAGTEKPKPLILAPFESPVTGKPVLFLSSAVESESWLAANKYILGTLIVVAIVIAAIVWLH